MRRYVPAAVLVAAIIAFGTLALLHAAAMSNGAPRLECTQCHADAKNRPAEFVIEGLPQKVEPGKTYKITIKITKGPKSLGAAYGGFAMAASAGKFQPIDQNTLIAKTPTGQEFITHSKAGSMKREWTFEWQAPQSCNGEIKFEVSVIAANGDGSPVGDAYAHKVIIVKCGAAQPAKPKTTTTVVTSTVTKTEVTSTTVSVATVEKSNAGLAVGVAVLIFLVVVGGYLLFARK